MGSKEQRLVAGGEDGREFVASGSGNPGENNQTSAAPPKLFHTLTACTRCRSVS